MGRIQERNAVVFGISTDTVEAQKAFHDREMLNFPLLADSDKKMSEAYGVLQPSGRDARVTFVIGTTGTIMHIDRSVNAQFERAGGTLSSRHGENIALLLSNWKSKIGGPVPSFSVKDVNGKTAVALPAGKKGAAVFFLSVDCPTSIAYEERIARLASDPAYKDVQFLGLFPNQGERTEVIKLRADERKFPFPVARDMRNALANHFGVTVTPTVWALDAKGNAVYSGAIDDNQDAALVKQRYLKDALDSILGEKPVATSESRAVGCDLKKAPRRARSAKPKPV
jgi:peroxiredoxin